VLRLGGAGIVVFGAQLSDAEARTLAAALGQLEQQFDDDEEDDD